MNLTVDFLIYKSKYLTKKRIEINNFIYSLHKYLIDMYIQQNQLLTSIFEHEIKELQMKQTKDQYENNLKKVHESLDIKKQELNDIIFQIEIIKNVCYEEFLGNHHHYFKENMMLKNFTNECN